MEKSKLIRIFDRQAERYERGRKTGAQGVWRARLLQNVKGRILELAVGAGANFAYYPSNVQITAVDFSLQMLEKARGAAEESRVKVDFILSDIETLNFPEDSFDTIVSTLSLCGYENPIALLRKLQQWCAPDGEIVLMEHGLSSNQVIALIQKAVDPIAHKMIGCHQNRDILGLLYESNLRIQAVESHWMRMVHLIWAKPAK